MGKHSVGSGGVFWRSLSLTILKWLALSVLPILAVIGGWNLLSKQETSGSVDPGADDPIIVDPSTSPSAANPSPTAAPTPNQPPAQILNGSGKLQFATAARQKLTAAGYPVQETGRPSRDYEKTTVFYQEGFREKGEALAKLMGASVTLPAPENLDEDIPLTLVLGADFKA